MEDNKKIAETLKMMNKAAVKALTQEEFDKAQDIFERSLAIEERLNLKVPSAESLVNIANILCIKGEINEAIAKLNQAMDIFKQEKENLKAFKTAQSIGSIYFQHENYAQAAQMYEKCIIMHIGGKDSATAYFQAACAYMKLGSNFRAQDYLGRAISEFEKIDDKAGIIVCMKKRAELHSSTGRKDLAVMDLRKGIKFAGDNEKITEELNKMMAAI